MRSLPDLLNSVYCNRCKTNLINRHEDKDVIKYKCCCRTTKRILLICPHCHEDFLQTLFFLREIWLSSVTGNIGIERRELEIVMIGKKNISNSWGTGLFV